MVVAAAATAVAVQGSINSELGKFEQFVVAVSMT